MGDSSLESELWYVVKKTEREISEAKERNFDPNLIEALERRRDEHYQRLLSIREDDRFSDDEDLEPL